jgi:hypothetical protein
MGYAPRRPSELFRVAGTTVILLDYYELSGDAAPDPVAIEANQVEELACALPPPVEDAHLDEVISIEDVGYC